MDTFNKLRSFNSGKKLEPSVLKNQNHGGSLSTYNSSDCVGSLNLLNFRKIFNARSLRRLRALTGC